MVKTLNKSITIQKMGPSNIVKSALDSGNYSNSTPGNAFVINLEVEITTHGRPVELSVEGRPVPGGGGTSGGIGLTAGGSAFFSFARQTSGVPGSTTLDSNVITAGTGARSDAPSVLRHTDTPPAGTYIYRLQVSPNPGTVTVTACKLVAREV